MDTRSDAHTDTRPDISLEPKRQPDAGSNELVKLIRKLRWIGMDDEAERLQAELTQRRAAASDSVVAMSGETD
jgi:hypothetical protein